MEHRFQPARGVRRDIDEEVEEPSSAEGPQSGARYRCLSSGPSAAPVKYTCPAISSTPTSSSTDQSPADTARLQTPVLPQCTYRWRCPVLQLPHKKSPALMTPDGSAISPRSSRNVAFGGARLTQPQPAGGYSTTSGAGSHRSPVRASTRISDVDRWSRLCTCAKTLPESADHATLARYSSSSPRAFPSPQSTSSQTTSKSSGSSREKNRSLWESLCARSPRPNIRPNIPSPRRDDASDEALAASSAAASTSGEMSTTPSVTRAFVPPANGYLCRSELPSARVTT
mmetsp:Transcript_11039/g.44457  ORF Transcript_11039/g.44457 Transcript_11039/m.44457 type:complete len:285 (-) Transcript_11039:952-1806(-)